MVSALHGVSSFSDAFQSLTEFKDGITEERIYPNFPFSLEFPLPDVMLPCVDFNFLSLLEKERLLSQFDFSSEKALPYLFRGCDLPHIRNVGFIDTSNLEHMVQMFIPTVDVDIKDWNIENVIIFEENLLLPDEWSESISPLATRTTNSIINECWYDNQATKIMPCRCEDNCIIGRDDIISHLHGDSGTMDCTVFNSLETNAKNALVRRMDIAASDGSRLFQNCDLTDVTNIGHFNTRYVEKFDSMFENATLNINLDKWIIYFYGYSQSFSFDRMMYGLQVPGSDNFAPVDNWNIPLGASTTDFHANADSNLNVLAARPISNCGAPLQMHP